MKESSKTTSSIVFTCWLELDLEYNEDYVGGGFGATCNGLIHYNKKGKHPKSDDYIWTDS